MIDSFLKQKRAFLNLIISILSSLLFPIYISDQSLSFSNSLFSVIFCITVFALLQYVSERNNKRMWIFTHILGLIFSFYTACGYSLDVYGEVQFTKLIISIVLFSHIIASFLAFLWIGLQKIDLQKNSNTKLNRIVNSIVSKPLLVYILIIICWVPIYISVFPGVLGYDGVEEIAQSSIGYSSEFPMLHTVIYNNLLLFSLKTFGNYNFGLSVYVICQMLLLGLLYTLLINNLYKKNINFIVIVFVCLYCSLCPVIHLLVVHSVRDVLFAMLIGYCVLYLYLFKTNKNNMLDNIPQLIICGFIFSLTILARTNFSWIYLIIVVVISILTILLNIKKNIKGYIVMFSSFTLSFLIIGLLLTSLCKPYEKKINYTSMTMMSQCLARTYINHHDEWSDSELEELSQYMYLNELEYYPEMGDITRYRLLVDENNLEDFVSYWIKLGLKYPGSYFDAIMANTQNVWFPPTVIYGYEETVGSKGHSDERYMYYDKGYYALFTDSYENINRLDLLPSVYEYYRNLGLNITFEKIPVVSMLFSIGANFWLLLNSVFYLMYLKKTKLIPSLCILLIYVLIFTFVPLALLRYFSALFIAMPFIIAFTLQPSKCNS